MWLKARSCREVWTHFAFSEDEHFEGVLFLFSLVSLQNKTESKHSCLIENLKIKCDPINNLFPLNNSFRAACLWCDLFFTVKAGLKCDVIECVWTGRWPGPPLLFKHLLDNGCPEITICQLGTWDNTQTHAHTQNTISWPRTLVDLRAEVIHSLLEVLSLQNVKCFTSDDTHSHAQSVTPTSQGADCADSAKPSQCVLHVPNVLHVCLHLSRVFTSQACLSVAISNSLASLCHNRRRKWHNREIKPDN